MRKKAGIEMTEEKRFAPGSARGISRRNNLIQRGLEAARRLPENPSQEPLPDAGAYFDRGNARHEQGDWDGAIADYTEAIRRDPDDGVYYYCRAVARHARGDFSGANADFAAARRLGFNPSS